MSHDLAPPPAVALDDAALFFDVDGTLVGIEQEPEAVKVSDALRRLLERLQKATDGALALISGRSIEQLDRLFAPFACAAAGLHGLEHRRLPGPIVRPSASTASLTAARRALERFAKDHPGILVENKGLTLALHYRMAAEHRDAAAKLVRNLVEADSDNLVLLEGKMVFELKPPGFDKGRAVADFMQKPPFRGRRPIFAGDDVTDETGFAKVREFNGLAVRVGIDDQPTEATHCLPDVAAMLAWLEGLADAAETRGRGDGA